MKDQVISWGKANVTKECEGKTLRTASDATPGFVVLSNMETLPWGEKGERGGIYTWEEGIEMYWKLTAGHYLLAFSCKERR